MNSTWRLTEEADRWIVEAAGWAVNRCLVDYAFSLEIVGSGQEIVIRVEGEFTVAVVGSEKKLSTTAPEQLGPALSLVHKVIDSIAAYKRGALEVRFTDGSTLSMDPDPNYEAWTIAGPGGMLVVSLPGGDLAVWKPAQ